MKTKTKTKNYDEIAFKMLIESQAKDDIRFAYNGIFYDPTNNCSVSTDGRRACIVSLSNLYKKEFENKIIRYIKTGFIEIDGNFPNYKAIMPEKFAHSMKLTMPTFDKKQVKVNLHINLKRGYEIAFSYDQKEGFANEIETDFTITFKPEYLNTISGYDIVMYWNSDREPVQFKLLGENGVIDEIIYLVMPVRR